MFRRRRAGTPAASLESALQQLPETPSRAVPDNPARKIMQMKISVGVRIRNLLRVHIRQRVVRDHRSGNVVQQTCVGVSGIGIFIDPPVLLPQIACHQVLHIHHQVFGVAHLLVLGAVENIQFRRFGKSLLDERMFHQVLNQLHIGESLFRIISANLEFLNDILHNVPCDLVIGSSRGLQRLSRGDRDPLRLKVDNSAVAFLHLADFCCNLHCSVSVLCCMVKKNENRLINPKHERCCIL